MPSLLRAAAAKGACTPPHKGADVLRPFCFVPDTISPAAQKALATMAPTLLNITLDNAAALRAQWVANATAATKSAISKVVASVESDDLPGIPVRVAAPPGFDPKAASAGKVLLYLHGGAYVVGACEVQWPTVGLISKLLAVRVLCPNYRLAPEHPFPAALDDAVAVYKHVLSKWGAPNVALLGDSAGGGLSLALLLRAHKLGLPYPAAVVLMSPWAELTRAGDTQVTLAGVDPKLEYEARLKNAALGYAGGDAARLAEPLLSPVRANWSVAAVGKLPPMLIQVGLRETLLSTSARLYRELKAAGQPVVEFSPWEAMWHVFQALIDLPEAQLAQHEAAAFIARHLDLPPPPY